MGLMTASGPLGRRPAGSFNFDPPEPGKALYLEPTPKRIRVVVAGETVADSRAAMIMQESGHQPVYYFPPEDVRPDLLEPSDRRTRCAKKGEASYYTIKVGDRRVENGAWYYPDPIEGAPPLANLIAFYWDRVDQWFEEDEEVFVHPRDPYHRVDVLRTSRHVRVSVGGHVLAESTSVVALFESNLPPRWYFPAADVVAELEPSDTVTACPYKGTAGYRSARLPDGTVLKDLTWCYEEPLAEVAPIAGRLCFFNERVDLELDGEPQEQPRTEYSARVHGMKVPAAGR